MFDKAPKSEPHVLVCRVGEFRLTVHTGPAGTPIVSASHADRAWLYVLVGLGILGIVGYLRFFAEIDRGQPALDSPVMLGLAVAAAAVFFVLAIACLLRREVLSVDRSDGSLILTAKTLTGGRRWTRSPSEVQASVQPLRIRLPKGQSWSGEAAVVRVGDGSMVLATARTADALAPAVAEYSAAFALSFRSESEPIRINF